jgi:hypothetical protein
MEYPSPYFFLELRLLQAYFRNIVGSVLEHRNKGKISIKQVT